LCTNHKSYCLYDWNSNLPFDGLVSHTAQDWKYHHHTSIPLPQHYCAHLMVHKNNNVAPRKEGTNQHMGFTVWTEDQGLGKQ
jgi:hypothetical protein